MVCVIASSVYLKNDSSSKFLESSHPSTAQVLVISVLVSALCFTSGATIANLNEEWEMVSRKHYYKLKIIENAFTPNYSDDIK